MFIRSSYYYSCGKPVCMRCRITQFARAGVGLCPFPGLYVREFELSDRTLVNRIIKITPDMHTICTWRFWTLALLQFVRKKRKLFTRKFSQTILKNQLGFITTSTIKLCFMQRQGWHLLTSKKIIKLPKYISTHIMLFHSIKQHVNNCQLASSKFNSLTATVST